MYNVEEKCMELINKEKDCGMNSSQFYEETVEFVEDVEDYYAISKQELEFIIEQVCEGYIDLNAFYIAMIPFEPDIDGILVGSEKNRIHIKCNHIREKVQITDPSIELRDIGSPFENLDEASINLEKCKQYAKNKKFPCIYRHGGIGNSKNRDDIAKELVKVLEKNNLNGNGSKVFTSGWIEYGPFLIIFVSCIDSRGYEKYKMIAGSDDSNSDYNYFLDTLINNFYEKWLEYIYYGLTYSTINYISDRQAIITASANDMFEARGLSKEQIITQISNYEYEGNVCKGKIVFTGNRQNIVRFKETISINNANVKRIRKLLEMAQGDTCLIASLHENEIIGIGELRDYRDSYILEYLEANTWRLSYKGKYILQYTHGQYRIPKNEIDKDLFLEKCENYFEDYDAGIFDVVVAAAKQSHGTMIVITEKAKEETEKIVKDKKGTEIAEVNLTKQSEAMIIAICSIDGAVMIDPKGMCTGVGLILANPDAGKGNPLRGARYNSAVNYVNNHKNSIAVVISEDGMVDVLTKSQEENHT